MKKYVIFYNSNPLSYSSITNARLDLRLPRFVRRSPSPSTCVSTGFEKGPAKTFSVLFSFPALSTQLISLPKSYPSTVTSLPYLSSMAPHIILKPHTILPPPFHLPHPTITNDPVAAMQSATGTHLP